MDILRAILDGIAIAAIFNGPSAALSLINPRFLLNSYPKAIQQAAPSPMSKEELKVKKVFSIIILGSCVLYEIVSISALEIKGFWNLFFMGYISWIIVNFGDFFFLDCYLIQGKYKEKIVIPGTEGNPEYQFGNWMKHGALPEHFILWPLIIIPLIASLQAGIILLIQMIAA